MATYRRYTEDDKANALALLQICNGNVMEVSRQTTIPHATITKWKKIASDAVLQKRDAKKQPLADMFEEYVRAALPVARQRVKEAKASELMVSVGIAIDKMRLLRDESTNINENRTIEEQAEEIRSELARRGLKLDKAG